MYVTYLLHGHPWQFMALALALVMDALALA